jgi:hypothetical protein
LCLSPKASSQVDAVLAPVNQCFWRSHARQLIFFGAVTPVKKYFSAQSRPSIVLTYGNCHFCKACAPSFQALALSRQACALSRQAAHPNSKTLIAVSQKKKIFRHLIKTTTANNSLPYAV